MVAPLDHEVASLTSVLRKSETGLPRDPPLAAYGVVRDNLYTAVTSIIHAARNRLKLKSWPCISHPCQSRNAPPLYSPRRIVRRFTKHNQKHC